MDSSDSLNWAELNKLKDRAIDVKHGRSYHAPEENDAEGLVHKTSAPKSHADTMRRVVEFLVSLGFTVDPEACSWKSITGINGYFQIDVQLLNPKTTAYVSSNLESVDRHQLALEEYSRTGQWIEPTSPKTIPEMRAIGLRQSRELSTYTNIQSLSGAIKTEFAFCVSAIHQSGIACHPIYGEMTPGLDLAEAVKNAIKVMLHREPRVAIGWTVPMPAEAPEASALRVLPPATPVNDTPISYDI